MLKLFSIRITLISKLVKLSLLKPVCFKVKRLQQAQADSSLIKSK